MHWVLLDVLIALFAVALLAVALLRLWRRAKALFSTIGEASRKVGAAGDALTSAQATAPVQKGLAAYPVGTSNEERA